MGMQRMRSFSPRGGEEMGLSTAKLPSAEEHGQRCWGHKGGQKPSRSSEVL